MNKTVNDFYSSTPGIKHISNDLKVKITCTYETVIHIPDNADYDKTIDDFISNIDISDFDFTDEIIGAENTYVIGA